MVEPEDVDAWLALRERATAGMMPPVRPWVHDDFLKEMLHKRWWRSDWTWLAAAGDSAPSLIGAVTLGVRHGTEAVLPVIHWLLVDPAWRRRGIGCMLISHLEWAAWNAGWRQVQLETHAGWIEAVAYYQSMGYAPLPDRSAR